MSVYNDGESLKTSVIISQLSTPLVVVTLQSAQKAGRPNGLSAGLFFNGHKYNRKKLPCAFRECLYLLWQLVLLWLLSHGVGNF